jgi:hypothetical protein
MRVDGKSKVVLFVAVFLLSSGASNFWFGANSILTNGKRSQAEFALVGFDSYQKMVDATDATLKVTILSEPIHYLDFGKDGEPDYPDQPGVPVIHTLARIDQVLRGDQTLENGIVTLSQLSFSDESSTEFKDNNLQKSKQYVVFVVKNVSNPGVGNSQVVWSPISSGQGIFTIDVIGNLSARRAGVWPEFFGANGSKTIHVSKLNQ